MFSNSYSHLAKVGRDRFEGYFNSQEGSVPWQYAMITSTCNSFDFMWKWKLLQFMQQK